MCHIPPDPLPPSKWTSFMNTCDVLRLLPFILWIVTSPPQTWSNMFFKVSDSVTRSLPFTVSVLKITHALREFFKLRQWGSELWFTLEDSSVSTTTCRGVIYTKCCLKDRLFILYCDNTDLLNSHFGFLHLNTFPFSEEPLLNGKTEWMLSLLGSFSVLPNRFVWLIIKHYPVHDEKIWIDKIDNFSN